jgi:ribonuclease HI
VVKGLVWFTDGSRTVEGTGAGVSGQSVDRRLSISLGKHARAFQAEVYAILACVHETETQDRSEKYVSVCSVSQAALKALQAAKTMSPLLRQCQKASNDISAQHTVGLYWVPGHARVQGNEIASKLARDSSVQKFVGLKPFLWVSRQNIRRKIKCWMDNQHLAMWCGPCSTQRQA